MWLNGLVPRQELMKMDQWNVKTLSKVFQFVSDGWPAYLSSKYTLSGYILYEGFFCVSIRHSE